MGVLCINEITISFQFGREGGLTWPGITLDGSVHGYSWEDFHDKEAGGGLSSSESRWRMMERGKRDCPF